MSNISKRQAKIYQFIRKDSVQHIGFSIFIFLMTFSCIVIAAGYKVRIAVFWTFFKEAISISLLLAIPVYFNFFFIYKGKLIRNVEAKLFPKAYVKGFGFYFYLVLSILTAVFFGICYAPVFDVISENIAANWFMNSLVILVLILCTTGVSYSKEAVERSRELERMERMEAIRKQRELERQLALIKKQIRPHFLFNTLANLQILAKKKSDQLPNLMGELSNLLRHLIYRTDDNLIALEEELEFIKSYIQLQKLQLSTKTDLQFNIIENHEADAKIAPMVLLIFIENCFKHFYSNKYNAKFIDIKISTDTHFLILKTRNSYNAQVLAMEEKAGGVGIKRVLENLDIIYKDRYFLESSKEETAYNVFLKIPLE